jgi:hypothetical protein
VRTLQACLGTVRAGRPAPLPIRVSVDINPSLLGELAHHHDLGIKALRLYVGDSRQRIPLILATGTRHAYFGHYEWEVFAPALMSSGSGHLSPARRARCTHSMAAVALMPRLAAIRRLEKPSALRLRTSRIFRMGNLS